MADRKKDVDDVTGRMKETYRRDINKGYVILYLGVCLFIIVGEIVLSLLNNNFTIIGLFQDIIGNLIGALAAFLVFDIAHDKLSKDAYASEVSEQILDTLMYHPEALELYEDSQKKTFVNAFIGSIVDDLDTSDMLNNFLNCYLLTQKDFSEGKNVSDKDCRIKTSFSYRFVLDVERTEAFTKYLKAEIVDDIDPYFYVQEEINYHVKYLAEQGNNTKTKEVSIGFIYDNAELDRFLRGKIGVEKEVRDCLFREALDIENIDREMFEKADNLDDIVQTMLRPHVTIDRNKGNYIGAKVINNSCIIVTFEVNHDTTVKEHDIGIIFHIPKRWDTEIEAVLVEPTKNPMISLSYNEDYMDVEMYSFLNKGESSSYENSAENENGIYSIALSDEWVFPISGVVFPIKRKTSIHNL